MKGVAPTVGYMVAGETICLSANYVQPAVNGNPCGVLDTNSDAAVRGMARVDGLDACDRDGEEQLPADAERGGSPVAPDAGPTASSDDPGSAARAAGPGRVQAEGSRLG